MTDEEAVTAGELALGLLDGEERAAALRLMIADPAFAREVERWRRRFAALHGESLDAEPGANVEPRISRAIEPKSGVSKAWRLVAAITSVAAAILLVIVAERPSPVWVQPQPPTRSAPALIAVIEPTEGAPFGALLDLQHRVVRLGRGVSTPIGRQAELWAIGSDGVPHALGLITSDASTEVTLRRDAAIAAGTTLAISIEPLGGSPKPTPTGPVIAKGTLSVV